VDYVSVENGLNFHIDWLRGQKTGFFVDQRENRRLLESYSFGRNVLNMFCYTGGFSVYALRGGASKVVSVDSSSKAMMLTDENVRLNFGEDPRHESLTEDAFKFLKEMPDGVFDLIVLDPPAFAKHRGAINNALQGYKKLNASAIEKIASRRYSFHFFRCSQAISREQFSACSFLVRRLFRRRKVSILHQLTQPLIIPSIFIYPKAEYD